MGGHLPGAESEDLQELETQIQGIMEVHDKLRNCLPDDLMADYENRSEELMTVLHRCQWTVTHKFNEGHYVPEEDSDSKATQAVRRRMMARAKKKKKSAAAAQAVEDADKSAGSDSAPKEPSLPVESSPASQAQDATVSPGRPKHVSANANVPLHAHSFPNLGDDSQQTLVSLGNDLQSGRVDSRRVFQRQDPGLSLHDTLSWQFSSESYGEFIPESDSEHQTSRRGSDASDMHLSTDVFGNITAPLANFEKLADALAPLKEENIRENLAEQINDIHKKYVNLIETNSALRMQLSEVAIEKSGLRNEIDLLKEEKECLVQIIGKDKADTILSASQDPSVIESDYYSCVDADKSDRVAPKPALDDFEQTILKLKEQNEILVQENLKLTSKLQPDSCQPEQPDPGESDFEFDSEKAGSSPASLSEPTSPISPRTGGRKRSLELENKLRKLKEQNEILLQDNLTLTSRFESQVAKATWEITTMKSSYEEEIRELKLSLGNYQQESSKLKDAYTELKIKYECVTESENRESKMSIISELNKSREALVESEARVLSEEADGDDSARRPLVKQDSASDDEIVLDDDNDLASLRNRITEHLKVIKVLKRKIRQSEDATYMISLQERNKQLQRENEELQTVIDRATHMRELQQLRRRERALSSENEELRLKLNEAILQPNLEVDTLRERSMALEQQNRSLFDRLDNDVIKAEIDLREVRRRCDSLLNEKEELEDEFKACRDRLESDLLTLQHKYEEVLEENELLQNQITSTKDAANVSVHQMQVQVEELSREHDQLQKESDRDKDKSRKDIQDLKSRVDSLQRENNELKRDSELNEKELKALKESSDSYNEELKDQNTTLRREVVEMSQKSDEDDQRIDNLQHELNELKARYDDIQKYCDEIKQDLTRTNEELTMKLNEVQKDNEMMSESMKDLKDAKASLTEELGDLQGWYEQKEREYVDKISRLVEEAKSLKMDLMTKEKCLTEATEKVGNLEDRAENLEKKNRDLEALNAEFKGRVTTVVAKLEIVQNEMVLSEQEKQNLKDEVKEVMAGMEELADFDAEVWKTKQSLLDELNDLKEKFAVLEIQNKVLSDDKNEINAANVRIKQEKADMEEKLERTSQDNKTLEEDLRELMNSVEELADFDAKTWTSKESLVNELKNLQRKYDETMARRIEQKTGSKKEVPSTPVVESVFVLERESPDGDLARVKRDLHHALDEIEMLRTYLETVKASHEALKINYADCLKEKEALNQDVKDLMASLEELVAFDAEMWKGKSAAEGELQQMRNRYDDMQQTVLKKQEEIEKRKQLREEVVVREKVLVSETAPLAAGQAGIIAAEIEDLRKQLEVIKRDYSDVVKERNALREDVKELMASLEELVSFDAEIWKSKSALSGELQDTRQKYEHLQESLKGKQKEIEERSLERKEQTEEGSYTVSSQLEAENQRYKEQLMEISFDLRKLKEEYEQTLKEKEALSEDVKELVASVEELITFDANVWKSKSEMSEEFSAMKKKHEHLENVLRAKEREIEERKDAQESEKVRLRERQEDDMALVRSRASKLQFEGPSIWMDEKGTQIRCVVDAEEAPEKRKTDGKNWQDRYVNMQWKYVDFMNTIEEISEPKSATTQSRSSRATSESSSQLERKSPVRKLTFTEADFVPLPPRQPEPVLTGELGCDQCMILLHDNDRLRENLTRLQNELMSTRLDRLEMETCYSERNFFKEQKDHLEIEMQTLVRSFKEEKDQLNTQIKQLQERQEDLEKECAAQKLKYENEAERYSKLSQKRRKETLAEGVAGVKEEVIQQLQQADSEIQDMSEKLRDSMQQRALLETQVEHLKRECRLCERHIKDLEKEVETQYVQLDEMTLEHRELIEILAETKLQLEINRQHQSRNVGKMEEAVSRLEETMSLGSGRSTPRVPSSTETSPPRLTTERVEKLTTVTTPKARIIVTTVEGNAQPLNAVKAVVVEGDQETDVQKSESSDAAINIYSERNELSSGDDITIQAASDGDMDAAKLKVELAGLEELCNQLKTHEQGLLKQLEDEKEMARSLKEQLFETQGEISEDSVIKTLEQRIKSLEAQNKELVEGLQSGEARITELVKAKTALEERFRRERAQLLKKLEEKEHVLRDVSRKMEILERHIRRQRNLELMRHHRNLMEAEMQKQKQIFEMELDTMDSVIRERGSLLSSERARIVSRLDHLEGLVGRVGLEIGHGGSTDGVFIPGSYGDGDLANLGGAAQMTISHSVPRPLEDDAGTVATLFREPQLDRLSGMKSELERRYRLAIAKLRTNLKAEASRQRKKHKQDE